MRTGPGDRLRRRRPALYIAPMRSLRIGSIALVGLLGAGCAFPLHSATSTTSKPAATSTTLAKGPITPTAADKRACTGFKTYQAAKTSGSKPTLAELKKTLAYVRGAKNSQLRAAGSAWTHALVHKHPAAATKARTNIAAACTQLGLG